MFKVIHKESNEVFEVYDIKYNFVDGHPEFLIYRDNEWMVRSAKLFEPYVDKKKTLNEDYYKDKPDGEWC